MSYSTFKENQYLPTRSVRNVKLKNCKGQLCLLLIILVVVVYVVYLRINFEGTEPSKQNSVKRKMGGVLTYEFGYMLWNPLPTDKSVVNSSGE